MIDKCFDLSEKLANAFESEVTCGQVWWPILGICALHLTHPCANTQQWTHTHREHTPGAVGSQCCGARGAVGGSVPCSRVSPQLWYWGWREHCIFTPPTDNSCRTWDSNPRPSGYKSLYPLGHDCPQFKLDFKILGFFVIDLSGQVFSKFSATSTIVCSVHGWTVPLKEKKWIIYACAICACWLNSLACFPISEGMRLSTVEGVASVCRHTVVDLFAQCWLWPGNESREKGTLSDQLFILGSPLHAYLSPQYALHIRLH